ncbi:hypothetical protein U9M48_030454 [Paspalum notatum var. saurae]|uniref:Phosphomannomutase n=1 Tax=Paspalum notatum var. saurae TaxID=547442 RepID=A0AAQ3U330_PASNO
MAAPPALGRRKREAAVLALFDVDDTLTAPRKAVTPEMLEFMKQLRQHVTLGVVGGSDLLKITEQLGESVFTDYEHVFSENGLVAHKNGKLIGAQVRLLGTTSYISLKSFLLEKTSSRYCVHFLALLLSIYKALGLADDEMLHSVQEIINFALRYIADLDIPIKRSMKNLFSSYGRNCSQEERDEFEKYDKVHSIRPKMVSILREKFAYLNLTFSIGGQISFDFFPQGWDKTYCLKYLEEFQEIHFFGDKTYKGGNDYEIFVSDRTVGHTVTSPVDTLQQCRSLFMSK